MADQNYKNHGRYIPLWHFIVPLLIAALLGWGIYLAIDHHQFTHFLGVSLIVISILLLLLWWYARSFALRAHDRAIRAEENFRHFILTGKPLDPALRMSQIIALRFAPDDEFPILARKAFEEKLSSKQIKQEIKNWKADHNRV